MEDSKNKKEVKKETNSKKTSKQGISKNKTKKQTSKATIKNEKNKTTVSKTNTKKETSKKIKTSNSKSKNNSKEISKPTLTEERKKTISEIEKEESKVKIDEQRQNKKVKKTKNKFQDTIKGSNINDNSIVSNSEFKNLIQIILIIVAVFLIFYGVTTCITKNNKNKDFAQNNTIIQYDEILLGTLLQQPVSEYYVLVTDKQDNNAQIYMNLLSEYNDLKENALDVFNADLSNGFNKKFLATDNENSNLKTNDLKELKFKKTTLLKIKNKQIVAAYEEDSAILAHINSLLK